MRDGQSSYSDGQISAGPPLLGQLGRRFLSSGESLATDTDA
jgi:hypothetical protein